MSEDNNYIEILEQVQDKLNQINPINGFDIVSIKNSIESIEGLLSDSQAKVNFKDIKDKLEKIAHQVDNCNDSLLKDLLNDINSLKEKSSNIGSYLENIKNSQNLTLTSAEFEEFQKQNLDLTIKTSEALYKEITSLKTQTEGLSGNNNLGNLENQISTIHKNLSAYIQQIVSKLDNAPDIEQIGSLISDVASINQKNIMQTASMLKNLEANFNDFKNKDFTEQISKISDIYSSLNIIHAWIEKVGFLNKSIENVYARLGANIDFDDVSEKIDIIYENISALNNWTMKIDNIDGNMSEVQSKVASLSSCIEDTKNISESINNIKNRLDSSLSDDIDLEDLSNKMDIVYENLTALNEWSQKIDSVSDDVNSINNKLENNTIELRIDEISENISSITDKIQNSLADSKLGELSEKISSINNNLINSTDSKLDELSEKVSSINNNLINSTDSKLDELSEKVSSINETFEEELIASKIDLIYENINILNEWVSKIDGISLKSEELDNKFNRTSNHLNLKIDEITETLSNANKIIEDVPNIKDKLEELSDELNTITRKTKDETESYIYTLLDIETDFLKLHKFLDDKTQQTTDDINSLKERFEELNDDIASISKRTNKLILSADDANKEFKTYLEAFRNTITELDVKKKEFNSDSRFNAIGSNLNNISKLLQNAVNTNNNINTAFMYLAEWIDNTDSKLNQIQIDLEEIKNQPSKNTNIPSSVNEINSLKEQIALSNQKISELEENFTNYKNEDVSELKSLITGIIVQLNTALTPDIDSLNERIDKLSEENNNKITSLEDALKEKIEQQSKQINALQDEISTLNNKFDKLIEAMIEDNKNYEVKDILNYITSQITQTNEAINNNKVLNEVAEKLSSFDNNINKIVSYIEED